MADQGDLPRALRFAVSQIQPGSTGPETPMSFQDREWLNEVLGQLASPIMGEKDPGNAPRPQGIATVLGNFVTLIEKGKSDHLKDAVKNELQHISELGELIDRADDCDRKNAVAPISVLFDMNIDETVAPLCSILAELAQNSPDCQAEAMALVPKMVAFIQSDQHEPQEKVKAVYALSAILRGNPSEKVSSCLFTNKADGAPGVVDVLVFLIASRTETVQVRTKAAFLLSCLVERHEVRQYMSRTHEKTIRDIDEDDSNIRELVQNILNRIHTNVLAGGKAPLALAM